uniref:40S ribosomal protein S27 n=1 Tax=Cyprinus carpio carpio TaxID=630221 RepID=A0A9J7Z0K9_CYPCA
MYKGVFYCGACLGMSLQISFMKLHLATLAVIERDSRKTLKAAAAELRMRISAAPDNACCYKITTVFSHAQTVVLCVGCSTVLCQPTGGKARLTEVCSFRRKQH